MTAHLVVALSAHGFGHIGQVAPIISQLRRRRPGLHVTIRSRASAQKLRERLGECVDVQDVETDVGMVQADALNVDLEATARAYATFHADWSGKVAREAEALRALGADVLLANVPYLALAGAAEAGLPAVGLCSLNWAGVYESFFGDRGADEARILGEMLAAYGSALAFLQPEPSPVMPEVARPYPIGPLAELGRNRRDELRQAVDLPSAGCIVVVSFGGMDRCSPLSRWPRFPATRFIVPDTWTEWHPDAIRLETLAMPFADVVASCDVLIAKPGYGSFVEAACLGLPVLYVPRVNWPEQDVLVRWLEERVPMQALTALQFERGTFADELEDLWQQPRRQGVDPTGAHDAATFLASLLD